MELRLQSPEAVRAMKAYRRRRAGLVVLPIEVDAVALADVLIEVRLLDPNMADDRTGQTPTTPHNVTTPHFPYLTPLNYMSLVGVLRCGVVCGVVAKRLSRSLIYAIRIICCG
jgi:hypothetical protein